MNFLATNVGKYIGHKLNTLHHIHEIIDIDKRLIFENVHVSLFHLKKDQTFKSYWNIFHTLQNFHKSESQILFSKNLNTFEIIY